MLVAWLLNEFKKESGLDLSKDTLAMQRLREAAEKAKRELDGLAATEVSLPFITADATGPKHLSIRLTKAKFESLVEHLVQKTLGPCKSCLRYAFFHCCYFTLGCMYCCRTFCIITLSPLLLSVFVVVISLLDRFVVT